MTSPESPQPEQTGGLEFPDIESFERHLWDKSVHRIITVDEESGQCISISSMARYWNAFIEQDVTNFEPGYPESAYSVIKDWLDVQELIQKGEVAGKLIISTDLRPAYQKFLNEEMTKPIVDDRRRLLQSE